MDGTTRRACLSASCATSGTLEHIDWVLVPNTRYIRADGSTVIGTTDTNGLFTFPLTNSYLAFADATPGIWTGLTNEWQGTSYACNHWTQGDGASGIYASIEVTDVDAISSNNGSCSSLAHLACAEQ